jgi:hypothetical protein
MVGRCRVKMSSVKHIKKNIAFLRFACVASPQQLKQLIRTASKEQIICVCECALNVLKKNITLNPAEVAVLKKYKVILYKLAKKRVPVKQRQKDIEQLGKGFSALVIPALTALASAIGSYF